MNSTKYMSVAEKVKVLKDWKRFITSDFDKAYFTKRLYNHMIQHCSFIAHYNQAGFYGTYFEDPEDTLRFMKQFDWDFGCKSIEYGTDSWIKGDDYHDINTAMANAFEPYRADCYIRLKQKNKDIKLRQLEKLKAEIEGLD